MNPIQIRVAWRWLATVLLALLLLWLSLPRLLGLAAERWLNVPGLEALRVDVENVGPGYVRLREIGAVYRSNNGLRAQITLNDITVDYSLGRLYVERMDIGRAEMEITLAQSSSASPWPPLEWPKILLNKAQVGDLRVAVLRSKNPPLETQGSLHLQQTDGRLQAAFQSAAGLLRLSAGPTRSLGDELEINAEWQPAAGPSADLRLFIGRQPAQQPARLIAQVPLSVLIELGQTLGQALPVSAKNGTLILKAEAVMGEMVGALRSFDGEAEIADADLHATEKSTPAENPPAMTLAGKLHIAWKEAVGRLVLKFQPGFHWQLASSGRRPLQAAGRLDREFAIFLDNDVVTSENEFPFTIRSPLWGQWDGALQRVKLTGETGHWSAADAQLRINGQLKHWQHDAIQFRNTEATGDMALHWAQSTGIRSELAMQLAVERLAWQGSTPLWANRTTWKVIAEAAAKADGDFWNSLTLKGEADSPQLKIEQASGQILTLEPTRLQLLRLRPARSEGELLLASDSVKAGTWPAPDVRARLRLEGDTLRIDGSLLLQGRETFGFAGAHTLSQGCGKARLSAQPDLPTLGKLLQSRPAFLLPLNFQAGDADVHFTLDWCSKPAPSFDAKGILQVRDAALSWERARIEGLTVTLKLDGLHPVQGRIQLTAPRGELATGTPITDLNVDLSLSEKELTVQALHAGVLGGSLLSAPQSLPWPPSDQSLPLEIRQIDLGQLLALLKVHGLSGSGQLDGVLPLAYRDGGIEIEDARLDSRGAGSLKYAPVLSIPDNLGLLALRNFHFRQLGLHAWYADDGAYRTQALLEGSNPELYNGYPIRFRLNINGALPGLFRSALFSGDFNRHILEQLQSGKLE